MEKEQKVTNRHILEQEKYYSLQYMGKEQKDTNRHILEQEKILQFTVYEKGAKGYQQTYFRTGKNITVFNIWDRSKRLPTDIF